MFGVMASLPFPLKWFLSALLRSGMWGFLVLSVMHGVWVGVVGVVVMDIVFSYVRTEAIRPMSKEIAERLVEVATAQPVLLGGATLLGVIGLVLGSIVLGFGI